VETPTPKKNAALLHRLPRAGASVTLFLASPYIPEASLAISLLHAALVIAIPDNWKWRFADASLSYAEARLACPIMTSQRSLDSMGEQVRLPLHTCVF
jgi:hypothetical protein